MQTGIIAIAILALAVALFEVKRQTEELVNAFNNLDSQQKAIIAELKRIDGNANYLYNRQNNVMAMLKCQTQTKEEKIIDDKKVL